MIKGFTLVELIASLAIISIISLLSISPLSKLIESNKVSADVFKVVNIITTARSKAISTNRYLTICGKSKDKSCARNWLHIKVIDKLNKQPLHQTAMSSDATSAKWYAFQNKPGLTIAPTGFTAHQNGSLYLCNRKYKDLHRAIVVSKSGRVTVEKDTDEIHKRCKS